MYAHKHGCEWSYHVTQEAASNGQLECLKYAHENGCPWDSKTTEVAAKNGHLECLKYGHEHGCPWDFSTTVAAAESGNLECLKYTHEKHCVWTTLIPRIVAKTGNIECFKYCFEVWKDPQDFWLNDDYADEIIRKIDLDDPVWRKLVNSTVYFRTNLSMRSKVSSKEKELEQMKKVSASALQDVLPDDLIKHCIWEYF
jgi:hypothetical protein